MEVITGNYMKGMRMLFVDVHIQFSWDMRLGHSLTLTDAGVNPTGHIFSCIQKWTEWLC